MSQCSRTLCQALAPLVRFRAVSHAVTTVGSTGNYSRVRLSSRPALTERLDVIDIFAVTFARPAILDRLVASRITRRTILLLLFRSLVRATMFSNLAGGSVRCL